MDIALPKYFILSLFLVAPFILPLNAQEIPVTKAERNRENTEWCVSYWYNANDTKLPRILMIGDSICNGYQPFVRSELSGTAYVSFLATSKCITDKTYFQQLDFALSEYSYDVIQFNNGLHSLSSNREDWEVRLRAVIKFIKAKSGNAKIVWASCTPLNDPAATEKAKELNAIASRVMAEEKIPTNDLFSLMDPLDRNTYWTDKFHFKDEAKKMQAKAVADVVRKTLGVSKASDTDAKSALKSGSSETGPNGKIE